MKKGITLIAVAAILVVLGTVGASAKPALAAAKAPISLKCVAAWPTHLKMCHQYHQFIDEANKRAKERGVALTVEKAGGPDVVATKQQFQAMRVGTVDMVFTAGGYFTGECIELSAVSAMKPDANALLKAMKETKALEVLSEATRKKSGCIPLCYLLGGGGFTLLSTKPINGADWSGMKIRSFSKQTAMGITNLGGAVTSVPAAEVYEALQRGIVDGVIGSVHDRWAWGEKGVYKYIMQPGCMEASTYMFISAKVWDGLPSDVKSLLKDVAQDVQNAGFFWVKEWEDEALQNYIKEGVQTFQLSPADEQKVAKAFRRDYLKWLAEQSPDYGARLFKLLEPYI